MSITPPNQLKPAFPTDSQNLLADSEQHEDIWQAFERVLSQFPDDALADLPKDLSMNHDHVAFGEVA